LLSGRAKRGAGVCVRLMQDFVTNLSLIARGSLDDKLRWTFNLYDVDGDGVINKSEMMTIVSSIYSLMGRYTSPAISGCTIRQHVDRIFEARQLSVLLRQSSPYIQLGHCWPAIRDDFRRRFVSRPTVVRPVVISRKLSKIDP